MQPPETAKRPVDTPEFWRARLARHGEDVRRAVWDESDALWEEMNAAHRDYLRRKIQPGDRVLDVGCGTGMVIPLMPAWWKGEYLGIDVSPDLLAIAAKDHPRYTFARLDASKPLNLPGRRPDVAVFRMVRHMIVTDLGEEYWARVLTNVRAVAGYVIVLEPECCGGCETLDFGG